MEVVIFELDSVRYGLPMGQVRELARVVRILPLPKAPRIIEGVIDVRGRLVPVLDLRARFRLPHKPVSHTDHLVLAWAGQRLVAIRADRVIDMARVDASALEDANAVAPSAEYVAGIARLDGGLVLIHDLDTFLSAAEAADLDAAVSAAPPPSGDA